MKELTAILYELIKAALAFGISYAFVAFIVLNLDYKTWDEVYRMIFVGLFLIMEILLGIKDLKDNKSK